VHFQVIQSGNRVEIVGKRLSIFFEIDGIELPQPVDLSFAIWILLPFAMRKGVSIQLDGAVDPVVLSNARRLSRIWEIWAPSEFRRIQVSSSSEWRAPTGERASDIHLFSGGVDSAFSLVRLGRRSPEPGHVLTIHGLDFALDKIQAFEQLLRKTDPLLEELNYRRVVIRSNAGRYAKTIWLTHGFVLAGCLFLLRQLFHEGLIAADRPPELDMLVFPWGTNHITNNYFAGEGFSMRTLSLDYTRADKVEELSRHPIACSTISCCGVRASRPDNCGQCSKCIRTKIMFVASTGAIPPIFGDVTLTEAQVRSIDLNQHNEYAHFCAIYARRASTGPSTKFPVSRST
jgi:hypothetical protein